MSKKILVEPTANLFDRSYIARHALFPWRATCLDTGAYASSISSGAVLEKLLEDMRKEQSPTQQISLEIQERYEEARPVPSQQETGEYDVRVIEFF